MKAGALVHIVAIGGTGMSALAGMLKERGFRVTGSDKGLYPPASTIIEKLGIQVEISYSPDNIPRDVSLAVIGNAVSKDNPEVLEIIRRKIPYKSFPDTLWEYFIQGKTSVVVSGTHGKTTSASAVSWVFYSLGLDPGFMIGGVPLNFNSNYRLGNGTFFISEGDEYDSAFFDKGPKFLHYRPDYLLLNSVEFDHADIYRDLEHVMSSFTKLLDIVNPKGGVAAFGDSINVRKLIEKSKCKVLTFGFENTNDWVIKTVNEETGDVVVNSRDGREIKFKTNLFGKQNIANLTGVLLLADIMGLNIEKASKSLELFNGVKRRQEYIGSAKHIDIYDDFAHHPTAVKVTLEGFKSRFPQKRIIAVFEPRSNSSRRNVFEAQYVESFDAADLIILSEPFNKDALDETVRFSTNRVTSNIKKRGKEAYSFKDVDSIIGFLLGRLRENDVVVIMSNGDFSGIHKKLIQAINFNKTIN
ncbi:MAG: UDP-N-acetylmuramate:L-alanyl-gamma-D-glutamyl-meso-diaminopimelate ligase [Candidatus Schekmanbacteria bacterium]|nr:UDP-N-acetylmuramate:L-alanyl-gamma-D-glutamyl-meso-diaminopimelate ligase [Candidatus Schekmanbacteria bacterium]